MRQLDQIEEIIRPIAEAAGAYLVDLQIRGERGGRILEVFVDSDSGVTTDLCAAISREVSRVLDSAGILRSRYHLVVSSPGVDRPLKFQRQYVKNVGRRLSVIMRVEKGAEKIEGELTGVKEDRLSLRIDETVREIPFDKIIEARVKAVW